MTGQPLPLARFTVLEVNDAGVPLPLRLATSLAGKIAADLGADVLKIEPRGGDPVRKAAPKLPPNGQGSGGSALFQFLNTSKRSLVLDLTKQESRAILSELLAKADACLFEEPASVAPLIKASQATPIEIAPFPLEMDARRPFSELTLLAFSGLLHMVGEPDRKPLKLGGHQASYAAGLTAFTGLAAALAARDAGRPAPAVRVSLAEVLQWVNWKAASGADAAGVSPGREGKQSEFQLVSCANLNSEYGTALPALNWAPDEKSIEMPWLLAELLLWPSQITASSIAALTSCALATIPGNPLSCASMFWQR